MKIEKAQRNYGIDLLRIISMFFVLILHCYGQGGIIYHATQGTIQYKFSWMIEIIAYCAVNIFALISGYVMYDKKSVKLSSYINLWFQVVFYGLIFTILFQLIDTNLVVKKDLIISMLPVTKNLYWYFTAYTGLFLLMPFLNKAITNISNEALKKYFIIIIFGFSIYNTITDNFKLSLGYSVIWLVLLYIMGAILKKCEIAKNIKTHKLLIALFVLYLITFLYKIYAPDFKILDISITNGFFVNYTSPTVLGAAILYLLIFSRLKFNNMWERIIKYAAPSAFAAYLLNNQRFFWNNVMNGLFINISNRSIIIIFIYTFGFSIAFLIMAILVDRVRIRIFKLLKIQKISIKIQNTIHLLLNKIAAYI